MSWMRGNIDQVMTACRRDIYLAMDFLNHTIAIDERKADYLGFDHAPTALSIALELM